ncbi:MAG: type II toxin-antitoxin system antitoxin SocA domain-containing protein [Bacteroidota bacterium]
MEQKEISASIIANFFLSLSEPEIGDFISNLKVQKLVYYAQGFHLAMFDQPLFLDPIYAWEHGPVVPTLYHHFKRNGSEAIPLPTEDEAEDFSLLSQDQKELLHEVYTVYGQYSAWKLRNLTHQEAPWIETTQNSEISHVLLQEYFQTLLIGTNE